MTKETDYSVNEKYLSKLNLLNLVLTTVPLGYVKFFMAKFQSSHAERLIFAKIFFYIF